MFKFIRNLFKLKMDSVEADYDMLDLLAWNCNQLANQLIEKSDDEQAKIIEDYIKRVDTEFKAIKDFKEDLDWFNVTEPLSLKDSLEGKVVLLDFFTYCCINCMHILPDLKKLEKLYTIEDGLVVVGVHSAKFDNEKDSVNILSAVQRYDITHPVVNDSQSTMWMDLRIKCWPTLLALGPRGNPLFVFMGEGHSKTLKKYIGGAINYYRSISALKSHNLPINPSTDLIMSSNLKFPGKIACSKQYSDESDEGTTSTDKELYVLSDSGNHRILIIEPSGKVVEKIGGKTSGFIDGNFEEARFNSPQGVMFFKDDIICVADTENHAVRQINLTNKIVTTIGGHGKQGNDQVGGLIGTAQEISSPWDVSKFKCTNMDMSFHVDEKAIPEKDIILVAMAGTHQIWAIFMEETIWWKFKKFPAGAVAAIAGNGHEENRNNSYPQNAAFAQPSGLAISAKHKELYIADSESSCIRKLFLADGKVLPVAGGDRNPLNLFAFGDLDGSQMVAKLQHPLGVAYSAKEHHLYVADTYNHKIKEIDLSTNTCNSCIIMNEAGNVTQFNEPGGLCLSPDCERLYVCDTNNHTIECVDLATMTTKPLKLIFNPLTQSIDTGDELKSNIILKIQPTGAKILLGINLAPHSGVKFTENAPQKWTVELPNDLWSIPTESASFVPKPDKNGISKLLFDITAPSIRNSQEQEFLLITFKLSLCAVEKNVCFAKIFTVNVPVIYTLDGMDSINEEIKLTLSETEVSI